MARPRPTSSRVALDQRRRVRPRRPGRPALPRDDRGTLVAPWTLGGDFTACQSGPLPTPFEPGAEAELCLVYLAPDGARIGTWSSSRPRTTTRSPGPATSAAGARRRPASARRRLIWAGPTRLDNGAMTAVPDLPHPGLAARRHPGRARADGRHHQRRLPPALRRAGRRALRLRDDHQPRPRRGRRGHAEDARLRRARDGALGAALRHRPGLHRQGRRDPLRRPRRRARRPQLRLPGAQGDPQGRRGSAAVEARPARRDPRARGRRRGAVRRPGDDEDPQGPRRRPPDLPRRRPDRPGDRRRRDRPARAHRRSRPTPARPTGTRSPPSSTTSTSRSSATATSGRPPTRCGWSSRPAPPASSSAAAASGGPGCSATWPPPSTARTSPPCPTLGEVKAMMRRHAELLSEHMGEERGCKEFRKHVSWYLKGFPAGGELRHQLALVDSLAALDDAARRARRRRAVPRARARHAARTTGGAAQEGRAPRGVARRHRRPRRAPARGRRRDHRGLIQRRRRRTHGSRDG